MPNLDEFLHITAAAKYVGCCVNTLRNWEVAGKLCVYRNPMNRYRLYKVSDLDDLLRQIEQTGRNSNRQDRSVPRHRKPR